MRLALLQMRTRAGDVEANLARIEQGAVQAARAGAELLMAPELALPGYGAGPQMRDLAEPAAGAQVQALEGIACQAGVALVAGFAERSGESIYNAAVMVGAGGEPIVYRKTHLYGPYERELFSPGRPEASLVSFGGLKLGLLICYDVEFPENARRLARAGADALLVPTALPAGPHAAFIAGKMIAVRAFENQVFVAYANLVGADERFAYAGLSQVSGPDGAALAKAAEAEEALLIADLEPGDFAESREVNSYLSDLRR
jgi:predicted amidohydrolase